MHVIAATDIDDKDELTVSYTSPLLSTPMRQVSFFLFLFFSFFVECFNFQCNFIFLSDYFRAFFGKENIQFQFLSKIELKSDKMHFRT